MLAGEGRTQLGGDFVVVKALDRRDGSALAGHCIGDAGARRHAVKQYGTGAAYAVLATEMGARQIEPVAHEVRKTGSRFRQRLDRPFIDNKRDTAHAAASWTARFSVLTRM